MRDFGEKDPFCWSKYTTPRPTLPRLQPAWLNNLHLLCCLVEAIHVNLPLPNRPKINLSLFILRYNPKAWMFLMPVAVFVILYSIPRFFELETKFESRSLCATTESDTMTSALFFNSSETPISSFNNQTLASDLFPVENDSLTSFNGSVTSLNGSESMTSFNGSESIFSTLPTFISTSDPCPTVWEPQLGIKPLRFNPYYVSVSFKFNS